MPTVRKVQPKVKLNTTKSASSGAPSDMDSEKNEKESVRDNGKGSFVSSDGVRKKRVCQFCKSKSEPLYYDAGALRRFLSDRGRIYPRSRSGACAKHQRRISREIKRARLLALLPFSPTI